MDEMERRTQQVRRCSRWRGESSPARVVCVCGMCAVGLADYRCALPRISIVLPISPCNSVGMCGLRLTQNVSYSLDFSQTQTDTDARDHHTFLVVYDSREM